MNDDITKGNRRVGRSVRVNAFGDNPDEIELSAIDKAREFFGKDIRLTVARDYEAHEIDPADSRAAHESGKAWYARITVTEVMEQLS